LADIAIDWETPLNGTTTHFQPVDAQRSVDARAQRRRAQVHQALSRPAFALMELIIFVVVVGLLATVVIPQFTSDKKVSRQNLLKDDLQYLRTQIAVYRAQHQDVSPGYAQGCELVEPNARAFADQLTLHSDINCNLSANASPAFPYGPYIKQLPVNPFNNSSDLIIVPNDQPIPAPGGPAGWIYKAQTQEMIANLPGKDDSGIPYINY
jgi:type II secretory pathway pseudopilin PulG